MYYYVGVSNDAAKPSQSSAMNDFLLDNGMTTLREPRFRGFTKYTVTARGEEVCRIIGRLHDIEEGFVFQTGSKIHELKLDDRFFDSVKDGTKSFEIRFNDRGFTKGDTLRLYRTIDGVRTDESVDVRVAYILTYDDFPVGLKKGFVIMSIEVVP